MATILNFPNTERETASGKQAVKALPPNSGSAKILMFTGIRIERRKGAEPLRANGSRNGDNCGFISF